MQLKYKFLFIILSLLFLNVAVVSANDFNSTETVNMQCNDSVELLNNDLEDYVVSESNGTGVKNSSVEKTTPQITIDSNNVKSKDTIKITLKDINGTLLKSKKLTAVINNKKYSMTTNSKGISNLNINLPAKTYKLTISFDGDDQFNNISTDFNIKVSKLNTHIVESANFVVRGNTLYFYLRDSDGNSVSGKKIIIKFNGKTYTKKTNKNGRVAMKIKLSKSRYSISVKFKGDNQFKASSKKLKIHVTSSRSINIGNSKMLTNGYVRVYLKVNGKAVSQKVILMIGSKKLSKKANSEGIAIFKPNVNVGHYNIMAKVGKYYSKKPINCYEGDVKDPLKESSKYKNGKPDIDVMPGNYVMGDDSAKYTLKKSQYREVLKRDSYCLFLHGKLTKYTFFKTKSHPKLNHIIKREKWNVIERAVNTKLVKKNKYGYWPSKITVSLKGKSYKYPFVRDAQNNGYTCGPTSCSMCSQVLKNYVCEKYIAKLAGTKSWGTSCPNMIKAMGKNYFIATYFYKSTFSEALKELKNGGCALVFHANNHYVSILDISSNGKKVLVSNSYGSYDNIPTKWVKVRFMKNKFSPKWTESLIIKLNYKLSDSTINSINSYYSSMGRNWVAQNIHQSIGRV